MSAESHGPVWNSFCPNICNCYRLEAACILCVCVSDLLACIEDQTCVVILFRICFCAVCLTS